MSEPIKLRGSERCPICGKSDFCYRQYMDKVPVGWNGSNFFSICNRTGAGSSTNATIKSVGLESVQVGDTVNGIDGISYTCTKFMSGGLGVSFEPTDLYLMYKSARREGKFLKTELTYATEIENNDVPPAGDARLDEVYRAFIRLLKLEPEHRAYLNKEGMSDGLIKYWNVTSIPESDFYRYNRKDYRTVNERRKETCRKLVAEVGELDNIPGFKKGKDGCWTYCGFGGIIFPLKNAKEQIYALRLRVNHRWHDKDGFPVTEDVYKADPENHNQTGKYVNFTTFGKDGCRIGCRPGVFIPRVPKGSQLDTSTVWCTEGEKKSIIGGEYLRNIFIDVPGVGSYKKLTLKDENGLSLLDRLWNGGVQNIIVAYDADKENNKLVLAAETGFVQMLHDKGFRVFVADWDISIGKGIDDLLVNGGVPRISAAF